VLQQVEIVSTAMVLKADTRQRVVAMAIFAKMMIKPKCEVPTALTVMILPEGMTQLVTTTA
jgi:hypothetical protein